MACLTNNFTKQLVDYHRKVDKYREEGERDCLHMHQVPLVTHILLCYIINFCLPAERSRCRDKLYSLYIIHVQAVLKSNIFPLTVTALLHSRQSMNFNRKDYISYIPQHLVGMDKCMDNPCKQRAYCLCHSFVSLSTWSMVSGRHLSCERSQHASWRLV